jgi:hypothetical protein
MNAISALVTKGTSDDEVIMIVCWPTGDAAAFVWIVIVVAVSEIPAVGVYNSCSTSNVATNVIEEDTALAEMKVIVCATGSHAALSIYSAALTDALIVKKDAADTENDGPL